MFTPTVAAVKFDLPSTLEQKACSAKIDEGLKTFWNLVERMQHAADQQQPIHQVEETLFRELLVIGRWMLQAFLDMAGTGDVGPTLTVSRGFSLGPGPRTSPARSTAQASLSVDLRRDRHRADLLRPRPRRSRPLGRPTPPAATPVFVRAPAVAGGVRGRRCSRRGDPEDGDDPRPGDHRPSVGGPQPGAGQRCRGVSSPPSGSGRGRRRTSSWW